MNLVAGARGAKAAVSSGDHPFASHHAGEALDALRDQLRMLDEVHAVRNHAWDQKPVVRQFDLLPDRPLVLVTRVCRLDNECTGTDLQHQVKEMLQLKVVHARSDVDAVAGVEANAVFW